MPLNPPTAGQGVGRHPVPLDWHTTGHVCSSPNTNVTKMLLLKLHAAATEKAALRIRSGKISLMMSHDTGPAVLAITAN